MTKAQILREVNQAVFSATADVTGVKRWAAVEHPPGNRVLYIYGRKWEEAETLKACEYFNHKRFTVEYAGRIDKDGRLVDMPPQHRSKLLADNAPSRETQK